MIVKSVLNALHLLNSCDTLDIAYPAVWELLQTEFGCEQLVLCELVEHNQKTIYLWDRAAQKLAPNMTLPCTNLVADNPIEPEFVEEISASSPRLIDALLYANNCRSYIVFPLVADTFFGTLVLAWAEPQGYDLRLVECLEQVVQGITASFLRSKRVQSLQDSLHNTRSLYSASDDLISTQSLDAMLKNVVRNSADAVGSSYCTLYVFAQDQPVVERIATYQHPHLPQLFEASYDELMVGLAGWAINARQATFSPRDEPDPRESALVQTRRREQGIGSILVAPLVSQGQVMGVLTALNTTQKPNFHDSALDLFASLANQAAAAISKARLHDETSRQVQTLANIRNLSKRMRQSHSLDKLLVSTVDELIDIFEPAFLGVNLLDHTAKEFEMVIAYPPQSFPVGYRMPITTGITGYVAQTKQIEVVPNIHQDTRTNYPEPNEGFARRLHTLVGLPLLDDDMLVGVMNMAFVTERQFDSADFTLFQAIVSIVGASLQRVLLLEQLEERVRLRNIQLTKANSELREKNSQLKELDTLKSRFISDVSHELRTPLTSMALYLDLLERRPDRQERYLGVVRREVSRLKLLVSDVMKIARFDSGRIAVNFELIDLTQLIQQELDVHRERAEAVGLTIYTDFSRKRHTISGDPSQLAEMFSVLFYNAINYTQSGYVEIKTGCVKEHGEVEIQIRDTGIGIPHDELGKVFQRFYRGSNASATPGSGLGLNIASEIARLHNGRVRIESEEGVGTTVYIRLPHTQSTALIADATQAATITMSK